MKTLLVPIEDHDQTSTMLETAAVFADRFGSSVDGVALRLAQFQAVGAEPIVAVTFPPAGESDAETLANVRARFQQFVAKRPVGSAPFRWRAGDPIEDGALGALARVYDIIVVGRPTTTGSGARMTTLESVLFDGGRPILIAPPSAPTSMGAHVVVSWNQSVEAARTMAATLPILHAAEDVTILVIDGALVPGPSGDDVKDYLAAHGIKARVVTKSSSSASAGAAILSESAALGADLLIKSAYTQSRLRQMIFGGATSHILGNAELPVLMAN